MYRTAAVKRSGFLDVFITTLLVACMISAIPHKASAMAGGIVSTVATAAVATGGAEAATTAADDDDGD